MCLTCTYRNCAAGQQRIKRLINNKYQTNTATSLSRVYSGKRGTGFTCLESGNKYLTIYALRFYILELLSIYRKALGERICGGCISDKVADPESYMSLYIEAFGLANTNMDINVSHDFNTTLYKI